MISVWLVNIFPYILLFFFGLYAIGYFMYFIFDLGNTMNIRPGERGFPVEKFKPKKLLYLVIPIAVLLLGYFLGLMGF